MKEFRSSRSINCYMYSPESKYLRRENLAVLMKQRNDKGFREKAMPFL